MTCVQAWLLLIRKSAAAKFQRGLEWSRRNPHTALWVTGVTIAVVLLVLLITHWNPYKAQREAFAPIFTLVAGLAIASVTLMRHFAQTDADRQRRITESFSKAIEQLGSEKLEVRLGGIYTLERISKESADDYLAVLENLTAFVRERTRSEAERLAKPLAQRIAECAYLRWENAGKPEGRTEEFWQEAIDQEKLRELPADISAVLTVIKRRSENGERQSFETKEERGLDFRRAVLQGADLPRVHLKRAILIEAHLEGSFLIRSHLEDAQLNKAHLERAVLIEAHLEQAQLVGAHLQEGRLGGAHLERANLTEAHLERADLSGAHLQDAYLGQASLRDAYLRGAHFKGVGLYGALLEGADIRLVDLSETRGLTQAQIERADGDAETKLPAGLTRPARWTDSTAPRP
jgi:uncharacterized protein YjbI with pentapeptide repeats